MRHDRRRLPSLTRLHEECPFDAKTETNRRHRSAKAGNEIVVAPSAQDRPTQSRRTTQASQPEDRNAAPGGMARVPGGWLPGGIAAILPQFRPTDRVSG